MLAFHGAGLRPLMPRGQLSGHVYHRGRYVRADKARLALMQLVPRGHTLLPSCVSRKCPSRRHTRRASQPLAKLAQSLPSLGRRVPLGSGLVQKMSDVSEPSFCFWPASMLDLESSAYSSLVSLMASACVVAM